MNLTLNPKIEVRQSAIEGKGLFAKEPFKRGERFKATCGEAPFVVMTEKEFEAYKQTVDSWDAVYIGDGKHRVGILSKDDDPSNYGNHSCRPNLKSGSDGMVVALRDIEAGEELTGDYAQYSPKSWTMECNCGTSNCVKIVRGAL